MKFYIPTREDIDNLQVGDKALNCFGEYAKVMRVTYRSERVKDGAHFVGVDLEFGPNSTISNSYVEGELVRTVAMSGHFTSWQIDDIEAHMKAQKVREGEFSADEIWDRFLPF